MMDIGLLVSMVVTVSVPALLVRPWPAEAVRDGVLDSMIAAAVVGVVVGRLSAVALDDPGSLTSLSNLLVIRSGVEFWPGALAATGWLLYRARREHVSGTLQLAALAPAALVAWACFEATCLIRGGCPGPIVSFGLRPEGLSSRMFPVGLAVAVASLVAALVVYRLHRSGASPATVTLTTLIAAASIRAIASIWLPHIGSGWTRQHRTSIGIALFGAGTLALMQTRRTVRTRRSAGLA